MIKINYTSDKYILNEEIECKISQLNINDFIEVRTRIIDENYQIWKSTLKEKVTCPTFMFNTDDLMLNIKYEGISSKNLLDNIPIKIFEKLSKKKISADHYIPKFIKLKEDDLRLEISILINNEIVDQREITYISSGNNVTIENIENEFIGKYYYYKSKSQPSILVIGGSMGDLNWSEQYAAILSNMGFNTLALSYFSFRGFNKLPKTLTNIDLAYFEKAIKWLKNKKETQNKQVGIIGLSKGAELALILGSKFSDQLNTIIAFSPSSHCFEGVYLGRTKTKGSWKYRLLTEI